ncbi:Protein SHORT HYPOCOTYL IN WHITE LIGHT 1 [Camellia lanceoleosa]|nr:Protein SHORT HYPOCOTYL IN WHITE LIGHT 1 [Camellia lanceoleosa]
MAGAATVSPFISLTCTDLRNTISPSRPLSFPPQSLVLHHHFFRTRFNGNSRLISTHRSKFFFADQKKKKLSKRVRKASRSVLPAVIPPQLVSFAVDGVLLLASLSILKALLEVACTIGGTVFMVILLLRVIWAAMAYFQSSGNNFNQSGTSYGRTQPVT